VSKKQTNWYPSLKTPALDGTATYVSIEISNKLNLFDRVDK